MVGIATALSSQEYRVPTYQRSYAWKDAAVQDFWDDLNQALDANDPDYFLGTLVLTPDENDRRRVVIDGQQRLATTTLLLTALRDVWIEEYGDDSQAADITSRYLSVFDRRASIREPRLILNEEDDPFFRYLVVGSDEDEDGAEEEKAKEGEEDHEREDEKDVTPSRESHERLVAALDYLRERLRENAKDHGKRGEERLVKWLEFMDDRASVITVTVPTEADAFVIFETLNDRGASLTIGDLLKNYLFMRSGNRLETVKTSWVQALNELDVSAENEEFVTFLRHHWSSRHGAVRERELYREIKDDVKTPGKAVRHAQELAEAADLYAALQSPSDEYWSTKHFTSTTRDNIASLLRLDLEQNRPLLLAAMAHFTNAEIKKTLQALVSWSVRGIIVGGIGGGRTEKAYCEAAVKVRAGKIKTASELLAELSSIVPEDDVFEDAFERATQTKPGIARYFQLALERAERGDAEPELVPNANEDEVNLEHVLPQRAKKADWPSFDVDDVPKWANRLGNHCLLKKTENGKIGNKSWAVKQPVLGKSSLKLTSTAAAAVQWDAATITDRQARLAKLAVPTWPRQPKG